MVTLADLNAISGVKTSSATATAIVDAFNKYAPAYGVTTQKRIALALAHFAVETGGFRHLAENLNYTSAASLRRVWPSRFKTDAAAAPYVRQPQKLANFVYGQRMGNKGRPNAGWLYRGSGLGQVTGYDNFLRVEKETGIPVVSKPDLMRDPDTGTMAALILWQKWGMNELADRGEIVASRKKWNGGTHGLKEVEAAYARAMKRSLTVGESASVDGKPVKPADAVLKKGSKGPFVEELQRNLNELGFGPLEPDGKFGAKTGAAVRAFQSAHGLNADGWAGPRTIETIGKKLAEQEVAPKISEAEKTVPATADKAVKEEASWFGKIAGWLTGGSVIGVGAIGEVLDADWTSILAVAGGIVFVGAVGVGGFLLLGSRVAAKFDEINARAK